MDFLIYFSYIFLYIPTTTTTTTTTTTATTTRVDVENLRAEQKKQSGDGPTATKGEAPATN